MFIAKTKEDKIMYGYSEDYGQPDFGLHVSRHSKCKYTDFGLTERGYLKPGSKAPLPRRDFVMGEVSAYPDKLGRYRMKTWFVCSETFFRLHTLIMYGRGHKIFRKDASQSRLLASLVCNANKLRILDLCPESRRRVMTPYRCEDASLGKEHFIYACIAMTLVVRVRFKNCNWFHTPVVGGMDYWEFVLSMGRFVDERNLADPWATHGRYGDTRRYPYPRDWYYNEQTNGLRNSRRRDCYYGAHSTSGGYRHENSVFKHPRYPDYGVFEYVNDLNSCESIRQSNSRPLHPIIGDMTRKSDRRYENTFESERHRPHNHERIHGHNEKGCTYRLDIPRPSSRRRGSEWWDGAEQPTRHTNRKYHPYKTDPPGLANVDPPTYTPRPQRAEDKGSQAGGNANETSSDSESDGVDDATELPDGDVDTRNEKDEIEELENEEPDTISIDVSECGESARFETGLPEDALTQPDDDQQSLGEQESIQVEELTTPKDSKPRWADMEDDD